MLKRAVTFMVAIVAVGGAFVGSSNAKSLLQANDWSIVGQSGLHSEESASAACPGEESITCANRVDAQGNPTQERKFFL